MSQIDHNLASQFDRLPPHNLDAERCVIGSMMLDAKCIPAVQRLIDREAFYQADHQIFFDVLLQMREKGKPVDAVTLRAELQSRQLLEEVGGTRYLAELLSQVPSSAHAEYYARIVRDQSQLRQLISASNEALRDSYAPNRGGDESATGIIEKTIEKLWKIAMHGRPVEIWKLGDAAREFIDNRQNGGSNSTIDCGMTCLDFDFAGIFSRGGYTIVAGRPSMGKSSFIRDQLLRWAKAGVPVGLISVEETKPKIAGNALASVSGLDNSHVASGRLDAGHFKQLNDAAATIDKCPFFAIDTASAIGDIVLTMEILATQYGCRVIGVDHIHLIDSPDRAENRNLQLGEISKRLKNTIKRLNVVGVVAAQLSRPEKVHIPPPPVLRDLRDSGSLDEHADAVLMLHRQDYYRRDEDGYSPDGRCDVLIRKNRNGCVGAVSLMADLAHQQFFEAQPELPEFR